MTKHAEFLKDATSKTGWTAVVRLKNGRSVGVAHVLNQGEVASLDQSKMYFMGNGERNLNAVYSVDLESGEIGFVEPQFMTKLEPSKDGLIVHWAQGQFNYREKDFAPVASAKGGPAFKYKKLEKSAEKTFRVFASHYQFWLQCGEAEDMEAVEEAHAQQKFAAKENEVVLVTTESHANDYPVTLVWGDYRPSPAKKKTSFKIKLDSGKFLIRTVMEEKPIALQIPSGKYKLHVFCHNPGVDPDEKQMAANDAAFLKNRTIERYVFWFEPQE